jgi:hypothetical protein
MDVTAFFDDIFPSVMVERPDDFSLDGKYAFSIQGEKEMCWTIDLYRRPPVCYRGLDVFDCLVEAAKDDMQTLIERPDRARELFYRNRISVEGSVQMAGRLPDIFSLAAAPQADRGLAPLFAPMTAAKFLESHWPGAYAVAHGELDRFRN